MNAHKQTNKQKAEERRGAIHLDNADKSYVTFCDGAELWQCRVVAVPCRIVAVPSCGSAKLWQCRVVAVPCRIVAVPSCSSAMPNGDGEEL